VAVCRASLSIQLKVLDINDNPPAFSQAESIEYHVVVLDDVDDDIVSHL
jgi:hypothetical protein